MLVCTALLPFLLIRMRSHQDLGGRAARSRVAIPPGCAGHKCAPYLSQPRAAGQADAADPEHDEGGEPPRRDDQSRLGTASTTGARASTPAEAREAVVSGPGRAPVRRPASPSAPSSSASPAPCTGPPAANTKRCRDLARRSSRPGRPVSAAAAVAEAARERLASAPNDRHGLQRPGFPTGAAGETGHRGREYRQGGGRQELAAHIDALGPGVALEEPLDVLDVGAGPGEGGVAQAQAGGQAPDEANPGQHPAEGAWVVQPCCAGHGDALLFGRCCPYLLRGSRRSYPAGPARNQSSITRGQLRAVPKHRSTAANNRQPWSLPMAAELQDQTVQQRLEGASQARGEGKSEAAW